MTKLAQLQYPDPMHLEAAAGWIQLGDYDSANDELEKIRAEWRAHPDVLELRWLSSTRITNSGMRIWILLRRL